MWTKSRSLLLTRVVTVIYMVLLVYCVVRLPHIMRSYSMQTGKEVEQMTYALWASALPAFVSLVCLLRLLTNISCNQVFVAANVRYIRIVSWCCFVVTAIYLVFCYYSSLSIMLAVLMAFIGLILRVVKNVIAQAIELKNENDLTV